MTLDEVCEKVKKAAQAYYDGNAIMSDESYDSLIELLRFLNPDDDFLKRTGWGYELSSYSDEEKFKHPIFTGSVSKIKTIQEIIDFACGDLIKFSTKLDGNSIVAYYVDGKLTEVATRGVDDIGIIRTEKFKNKIPKSIPTNRHYIRVRGEALIAKADYTEANGFTKDKGFDVRKSSRNAVAGLIKRLEKSPLFDKYVQFVAYTFTDIETEEDLYEELTWSDYFKVEEQKLLGSITPEHLAEIKDKYKDNSEFEADGIVLKKTDGSLIAYKYEGETIVTDLLAMFFTIGKDQRLTPMAKIRPVIISGAEITQASVGSFGKAIEKGLWPVRATHEVRIKRSGEIIPHIIETVNVSDEAVTLDQLIPKCPKCGSDGVRDGEHIFCRNTKCPNVEGSRIFNFAEAYYPDMMGDSLAEKFFDSYGLKTVLDLIKFDKPLTKVIDGVGDSKIDLLTTFLEHIKDDVDEELLYTTFLLGCGESTAKKIVASGFDLKAYVNGDVSQELKLSKLANFPKSIVQQLRGKLNIFKDILDVKNLKPRVAASNVQIIGSFCITKARFKPDQLEKIEKLGWVEDKSLKKTTTVLVTKDPLSITDKTKAAKSYGITIMTIDQFLKFIER